MAENLYTIETSPLICENVGTKTQIAFYGGAFNPVHFAHLKMSQYVLDALCLNKIYLLPNATPPHKKNSAVLSFEQRVELLEVALKDFGDSRIEISFLEQDNSVTHYTYDTLQRCRELYPESELYFIMGMDSLFSLDSWKNGLNLIDLANLVVLNRPSYHLVDLPQQVKDSMQQEHQHRYIILNSPNYSFSSTEVRNALKAFQTPTDKYDFSSTYKAYLSKALTPNTLELILKNHYYASV